jgi:hypothetical protein
MLLTTAASTKQVTVENPIAFSFCPTTALVSEELETVRTGRVDRDPVSSSSPLYMAKVDLP